jgi:hypothetical protein
MMLRTWRKWVCGSRRTSRRCLASSKFRPRFESLEHRDLPAVTIFIVNNDNPDGRGSLRQAIIDANQNPNDPSGPDIIQFNIDKSAPSIAPLSALDAITEAVVIDGTTQPGFDGTPLIELNGSLAGAGAHGLTIAANGVTVRGLVINRFEGDGIRILGNNNLIEGNFIGSDANGLLDLGNGGNGVSIASANSVGASTGNAIGNNLIVGNNGNGVAISGGSFRPESATFGNQVRGNLIGLNVNGEAVGNAQNGVAILGASFNRIGGFTESNDGNTIAFNGLDGVSVTGAADGNAILTNSIFGNGGLGINLDKDGVTANDLGDADLGPNELFNFPGLKDYDPATGTLTVLVSGSAGEAATVRLQFFVSFGSDASGHGEGQVFWLETFVDIAAGTTEVIEVTVGELPANAFITATATDTRTSNTSEFSNALRVPRETGEVDPEEEVPTPTPVVDPRPIGGDTSETDREISLGLTLSELTPLGSTAAGVAVSVTNVLQLPATAGQEFQLQTGEETAGGGGTGSELRDAIGRAYTGEIGGMLFNDLNGDGMMDPGESPLMAHIVYLDANENGGLDDDEWWTITSKKGEYRFPHLAPGRYNVRPLTDTQTSQVLQAKGYEVKRIAPLRTTVPEVGRRQVELTESQRTVYDVNFGARVRVRQTPYVPVRHGPDETGYPDVKARPQGESNSPAEEATLPEKSPGELTETAPPR